MSKLAPSLADRMAQIQMGRQQRDEPPRTRDGALYEPSEDGRTHGRGNENAAKLTEALQSNVRPA